MNLGDINRPTSRVVRPPGGASSNIFGTASAAPVAQKSAAPAGGRFDPITGKLIEEKKTVEEAPATAAVVEEKTEEAPVEEEKEETAPVKEEELKKEEEAAPVADVKAAGDQNHEPHLGKVKNMTGMKFSQPPGGRSSIMFG